MLGYKAQVLINNNLLKIKLVVVRKGRFNHEVLIGKQNVDDNDLELIEDCWEDRLWFIAEEGSRRRWKRERSEASDG